MHSFNNLNSATSQLSLLAIDTAFDICSVALVAAGIADARCSDSLRKHADDVLPMTEELLSTHQIGIESLDFLAMVSGPGSFTGLRIGTAVVQGLAFGANLPIVCISSLAMMARSARRKSAGGNRVFTCLHAREDEFYFAIYADDLNAAPVALLADTIVTPAKIEQYLQDFALPAGITPEHHQIYLAGPGWEHELLSELATGPYLHKVSVELDALLLAELSIQDFHEGKAIDASAATPAYLKDDMEYRTV